MNLTRRHVVLYAVLVTALCCRGKRPLAETHQDEGGDRPAAGAAADKRRESLVRIDPEMMRDLRVTTAVVEARPSSEGPAVLGELQVNENAYAEVGSPSAARVSRLFASPGERVRRGQPLAELQSMEVGKTRGDYREAQARLDLARAALERKRALAVRGIAAEREVQEAEAEVRSHEASLGAAGGALQAVGAPATVSGDASRFVLRSPVSGTVLERTVARGQVTDSARPLFRIADLSRLWLTARAYERDAVRID
jgi:cobalt-zinc-cadmium efflux system membrane fusion protein